MEIFQEVSGKMPNQMEMIGIFYVKQPCSSMFKMLARERERRRDCCLPVSNVKQCCHASLRDSIFLSLSSSS